MNLCITGALGHIGSQLIRELPESAAKVHLVDNFLTQRYASLFDLPKEKRFCFHEMDILSPSMEEVIKDSGVVVHLAAVTDAESSFRNKGLVEEVNQKGFSSVASLCAEHGVKLFFPSTTSVYGVQSEVVDEGCTDADLRPQSPYAESKLWAEKLLHALHQEKGLSYAAFRLGTIFGFSMGMRFHTAVNKFIWQAATGQDITVWKTALNQKRPYCGLGDATAAINYVVENSLFTNQIYNIVTINLTVQDIIDAIRRYIPGVNIKFVDSPIMNQLSYAVSRQKSLNAGFVYKGSLAESLKEVVRKLSGVSHEITKNNIED